MKCKIALFCELFRWKASVDLASLNRNWYILCDKNLSLNFQVEQLFKDESLLAAYDLLEHFCGYITIHFPYILRHKYENYITILSNVM